MPSIRIPTLILACGFVLGAWPAAAEDTDVQLVIREHKFVPAEITVPARKKIKLVIENQDATAEEFESDQLNREKVVPLANISETYTVNGTFMKTFATPSIRSNPLRNFRSRR